MPSPYTPMAPTRVREPFHRDGWVYEEKVDGWRMLAFKDRARVRLVSRNGRDQHAILTELAGALGEGSQRDAIKAMQAVLTNP